MTDTTLPDGPTASELLAVTDQADQAVKVRVNVNGLQPEFVRARPIQNHPGAASLGLAGFGGQVSISGSIAELRAVVQEADRQLARLEVAHRVDEAVEAVSYEAGGDL